MNLLLPDLVDYFMSFTLL